MTTVNLAIELDSYFKAHQVSFHRFIWFIHWFLE
jgi:hypothetical protein